MRKSSKAYRSTNRELDSKKNIILELASIYDRLQNRIEEWSLKIRKSDDKTPLEHIDMINQFKLYRTKLKHMKERLENLNTEGWRKLKPEIAQLFEQTERFLTQ